MLDQGERACVQRGGQRQGICMETTPKEFVRTSLARVRWKGGALDKAMRAHRHASAPWLRGYAHASTGLRRGLDVALSATSARPVGQAARGFVVELLAWHPDWSSDGRQRRSVDGMPRHITANSTAQGGRRTHGPPCGTGW
jgi:hypothetical protein